MQLNHEFTVPADVDTTWATFMDLERVGSCFPGATVTEVTDDGFSGTVKVKLGPIALQYAGSGSFVSRDDAGKHAVIEAKGKDKRGNGTAGATVTVQLAPAGTGTKVDVVTDFTITGKLARFGRGGMIVDVANRMLREFAANLEEEVQAVVDAWKGEEVGGEATPGRLEIAGRAAASVTAKGRFDGKDRVAVIGLVKRGGDLFRIEVTADEGQEAAAKAAFGAFAKKFVLLNP